MADSTGKVIRVLIVDDSAFMRKALSMMLESDPSIKIVGTARDGEEGVDKVRVLQPDLVTMDIEMPRMDGLTALRQIMSRTPVPVMMVSSLTTEGASATLDALDMGAVDFIPKQLSYVSLDIVKIKDELIAKVKDIARRKHILMAKYKYRTPQGVTPGGGPQSAQRSSVASSGSVSTVKRYHHIGLIAIGSSTGGPPALQQVITKLPRNFPVGILIAQHMPPMFTRSLAERLNGLSQVAVREAENGEPVEAGTVYIAPGGQHITCSRLGSNARIGVSAKPEDTLYKPSVDVLMASVAESHSSGSMGVILTGMGRDGVEGMKKIKSSGGIIIAQSEETCVVYGMPRVVIEANIADHIAPIQNVVHEIISYF